MNKLNKLGCEVLDYKQELSNQDYSPIIKKSLNLAVDSMLTSNFIDKDVHYALKDNGVDYEMLYDMILGKEPYLKTKEQLFEEYEEIRDNLNLCLNITPSSQSLSTRSDVDSEQIVLKKDFVITKKFLYEYFYISDDDEYNKIMERKKFVEKFAILRLNKIVYDLLALIKDKNYSIKPSPVFYDEDRKLYGISLLFSINIELLENEESLNDISNDISNVLDLSVQEFNNKFQI